MPSRVRKAILELGLKYRPAASAALEGHQAKLSGLMGDLADVPPDALDEACRQWVRTSAFLPKASDLVALARRERDPASVQRLHDLAASLNRADFATDYGWEYFVAVAADGKACLDRRDITRRFENASAAAGRSG